MLKELLMLTAAAVAAQASATSVAAQVEPLEHPPDIVVEVRGLTCPFCAYGIEKKFDEHATVDVVEVAMEQNEVRLWLKPGEELSDTEVRRTVDDAGFTPGEIRRPEARPPGAGPEAG